MCGLSLENYHLYRVALWLVDRVPRWLVYGIAALLAELNFVLSTRSRRGVYANQRRVLPPDTSPWRRWQLARSAFHYFSFSIMDFLLLPVLSPDDISAAFTEVRGWEHLERAQRAGVGGIFVTAHMGSWELGGAYLAARGVPLTVVALSHKDPRIDQIFLDARERAGMGVVAVGGAMRKLYEALLQQRFVALLADRDISGRGPRLPFFGEVTSMSQGHAQLALRTGAWILPACTYRLPDGKACLDIRPPIIPDDTKDTEEQLTARCITILEEFITDHLEQWSSFYDLWSANDLPVA